MKVSIFSNVVNGVLGRNRMAFRRLLSEFEGKDIEIIIQRKKKTRSNNQNAYYWGVIVKLVQNAIKEQWGERMTSNDVHSMLKTELNYVERYNEKTGEVIKVAKSTTQNTTTEQEEYHEECRRFAKEWFNIDIPLPNEQIEIEL